ncbi:MAG: TonB-dependent receptor [Acidobacteria bacterium]|nr:TonB-dependent receptor [Acidobacteriota bacterium]
MKRLLVLFALLAFLGVPSHAFSQSSFASLSGTISDTSDATIPGVTVTATNVNTGITNTSISNDSGVYSFPSLLPGKYTVSAELDEFQTQTFKDVALGNAAQVRLNFKLEIAGLTESIVVSVASNRVLLESSSSSGEVLVEEVVKDLPLVNSNALDLVKVTSAYIPTGNFINNANAATIAGVSIANLGIQRDGVDVTDVRYPAGIHAPTQINPDLVGEFKMITSPVDAEMGRGNSQIQVQTKSGTNAYHGGAVWEVQNSALDSNQWIINQSSPTVTNWRNIHQYTLSASGPIIKNKTFFFVLWNGQISRGRDAASAITLTDCARKGIFRYFDNWSNGRYLSQMSLTGTAPSVAVVDVNGQPVTPPALFPSMLNADGSHKDNWEPHNGILRYASVFGIVTNPDTMAPDCSNAVINTNTGVPTDGIGWDEYRKPVDSTGFVGDSTGYISDFISYMPPANNYSLAGDGLNTAAHSWTRSFRGNDNLYNVGEYNNRKQINIKIDHNFNDRHRINGSWSYDKGWSDNNLRVWPNGFGGFSERRPQVLTINFTSTLRPNLLNEVRFGMARTGTNQFGILDNPETGDQLRALLPVSAQGLPLAVNPGTQGAAFNFGNSNFIGGRWNTLLSTTSRDTSPRYTFADTLTWVKGQHSFRMGGEMRLNRSEGLMYGANIFAPTVPIVRGGNPAGIPVTGIDSTNMPGLNGNNSGSHLLMQNLLTFMSASMVSAQQNFFINSADNIDAWNDPAVEGIKIRDFQQKEFAFFFKDDWKVSQTLTLNLGLRWEYYGVPYYKNGMTVGLKGGPGAAWGISGRSWDEAFWKPGAEPRADITELIFIGPESPNSGQRPYQRDSNNFGPAVGFALQLPWLGAGKTVLRGGYQLTYTDTGRAAAVEAVIANPPGSTYPDTYTINNTYVDLAHIDSVLPVPQSIQPMRPFPMEDRSQTITFYEGDFQSPMVHNLTMALTRNIGNRLTVDLKYIGTLVRKNSSTFNINTPNILENGLKEAFDAARYGLEGDPEYAEAAALLDLIFDPVRGAKSGAQYLRDSTRNYGGVQVRRHLANGDYQSLAQAINMWNNPTAPLGTRSNGYLLRESGLGENFIVANPQFATVNINGNRGYSNYHSMQAQVTLRPTAGFSVSASYTWSKILGISGGNPSDPLNFDADYTAMGSDRRHVFSSYGTFELPIGPNGLFLKSNHGVLSRVLESWQASWIFNASTGAPINWTASNMSYGTTVPDQVGDFPWDKVGYYWPEGENSGNLFQNSLQYLDDPQCTSLETGLQAQCTLQAVADSDGNIILQNPLPMTQGNFGYSRIYGLGFWNLDMALSKTVRLTEGKSLQIRVDAANIFNHPTPGGAATQTTPGAVTYYATDPALNLAGGDGSFAGNLNGKAGNRAFQARIRFTF